MVLFQQMIVLFIIMIVGLISYKKQIITDEVIQKFSSIVINVANPCLIISSVITGGNSITGKALITALIAALIIFTFLIGLAEILPFLLHIPKDSYGAYKAMTVFSNIGFMGFPIISAVYGNEALLFGSIFILPYNLLIYTYGIRVMKKSESKTIKFNLSLILNNGVIACIIAIIIFITKFIPPVFAVKSIKMISDLAAPLSMMVIGASFATINIKEMFTNYKLLIFSIIKLLVVPIVGVLLLKIFIKDEVLIGVCMIMLATPVGSMVPMLAQEYNGDYATGVKGVAVTTLLSVITMSVVSLLVL